MEHLRRIFGNIFKNIQCPRRPVVIDSSFGIYRTIERNVLPFEFFLKIFESVKLPCKNWGNCGSSYKYKDNFVCKHWLNCLQIHSLQFQNIYAFEFIAKIRGKYSVNICKMEWRKFHKYVKIRAECLHVKPTFKFKPLQNQLFLRRDIREILCKLFRGKIRKFCLYLDLQSRISLKMLPPLDLVFAINQLDLTRRPQMMFHFTSIILRQCSPNGCPNYMDLPKFANGRSVHYVYGVKKFSHTFC